MTYVTTLFHVSGHIRVVSNFMVATVLDAATPAFQEAEQ
jgi:hypothetical protein